MATNYLKYANKVVSFIFLYKLHAVFRLDKEMSVCTSETWRYIPTGFEFSNEPACLKKLN